MNILLAIKGFEQIPNIKEAEPLHIIFSRESTVPAILLVSMLNKENIVVHFLEEKRCDDIAIAVMIGKIVSDERVTDVTVFCPTEAQAKVFDGIHMDDVTIKAKKITNITKPKRNSSVQQQSVEANKVISDNGNGNSNSGKETETKKRNRKILVPEKRIEFLIDAGIEKEYAPLVLDAIENSSDVVIGFDMQLRTKLAAKGALDKLDTFKSIVTNEIYKKLKD